MPVGMSPNIYEKKSMKLFFLSRPEIVNSSESDGCIASSSMLGLQGKPQGKATDPLIHEKGSVTLLLQLGRKAHVHAPTRDED